MKLRQPSMNELNLLRENIVYDAITGTFRWAKFTPGQGGSKRQKGQQAGCIKGNGHYYITLNRKQYLGSHVAWFLFYGMWPLQEIDHKDRNPANDKIDNLRLSTRTEQMYNINVRTDSSTQVKGVRKTKTGKFVAYAKENGKQLYMGTFDTLEEARAHRDKTIVELRGDATPESKDWTGEHV